jgi:hypothetical protein
MPLRLCNAEHIPNDGGLMGLFPLMVPDAAQRKKILAEDPRDGTVAAIDNPVGWRQNDPLLRIELDRRLPKCNPET